MKDNTYVKALGIHYEGVLKSEIKKSNDYLRPIIEAFVNSYESLPNPVHENQIIIRLYKRTNPTDPDDSIFNKIEISDSGVGFNEENWERFLNYKDDRKGKLNKGSGRLQYVKFFRWANFESCYEENGKLIRRTFKMSKEGDFKKKNALVYHIKTEAIEEGIGKGSKVEFTQLLDQKDEYEYHKLNIAFIKNKLINHFLLTFCLNRDSLPMLKLEEYLDETLIDSDLISDTDIPEEKLKTDIDVSYSKFSAENQDVLYTDESTKMSLTCFVIDEEILAQNELKLTCKGEIAENKIDLKILSETDTINDKRYLFLISGDYLDEHSDDTRGELEIYDKKQFINLAQGQGGQMSLFAYQEVVLLEDIQSQSCSIILEKFSELRDKVIERDQDLNALKDMFLLDGESIAEADISPKDNDREILKKVYRVNAVKAARQDASIKKQLDYIKNLSPKSEDYLRLLKKASKNISKHIPAVNKESLSRYISRRIAVLELFEYTLSKLKSDKKCDESLLHSLIFKQNTQDPSGSDLWLFSEEYVYFQGSSDCKFKDIAINGKKLFSDDLDEELEKKRFYFDKDLYDKKPDILLFPKERKCIIIELKDPKVDAAKHIDQITDYASLIHNFSSDEFGFTTYYGYLIGEKFDDFAIQRRFPEFTSAESFDYLFRPYQKVTGLNKEHGSLYTEVISYTSILERAKLRSKVFIDKLKNRNS
jgi:hypothetical protein